ncbi:hypothetical protein IQ06DRAFT_360700 [Phaeosphaeriaceae sp. SRC1lsM3a]|nr:hypothetical protein IQ06DRAFT_360700 [Stagonospora sp. SRC1lsM3a]
MPDTNSISPCSSQQDEGHWAARRRPTTASNGWMQRKQAIHRLRAASWSENGTLASQSIRSTGQHDGLHARSLRPSTQPMAERLKRQLTSRLSPCMGADTPICPRKLQAVPNTRPWRPRVALHRRVRTASLGTASCQGPWHRAAVVCFESLQQCRHLTRIGGNAGIPATGLDGGCCHRGSGAVQQRPHERS